MNEDAKYDLIRLGISLGKPYSARSKGEAIKRARDNDLIDSDMALELALEFITDADRERREL